MEFIVNENREVVSALAPEVSKVIVKECFTKIGTVQEVSSDFIVGSIRYGLQRVHVRVSWIVEKDQVRFVVQSWSDDIWRSGAKSAKRRLIELIQNHNNPGYQVDRLGMHPAAFVAVLCFFTLVVGTIVVFVLKKI